MPIEFTGEDNGIAEFYIAHHNSPLNIIGGIEGRVKYSVNDDYYTVRLYIPKTSFKADLSDLRPLVPDTITVNTGMSDEQLEVYRLPVFKFSRAETDGMYLFEFQDYIMQKSKSQVYKYAPEAFKEMFPEEYKERTIKGFVDVAKWNIDQEGFERFCDSKVPIEAVGWVGTVDVGNYSYIINGEMLDPDEQNPNAIPYDQYCPRIIGDHIPVRYVEPTENSKFEFSPSKYTKGILPIWYDENTDNDTLPRTEESTRDLESFKKAFIEKLAKDECITLEDLPKYKDLKATGKTYYEQANEARKQAAISFSKADKLTPVNLEEIGWFYKPSNSASNSEKCVLAAEEMTKDGYDPSRISLCLKAAGFKQEDVAAAIKNVAAKSHNNWSEINPKTHPPDGKGSKIVR